MRNEVAGRGEEADIGIEGKRESRRGGKESSGGFLGEN